MTGATAGAAPGGATIALDLPPSRRGERLDRVLAALLPDLSRAGLQRLIREGRVRVDQAPARAAYRVRGGEQVAVDMPSPEPATLLPEALALDIIFQDSDLLVVNKPAGMVVHPGAGRRGGTLANALLHLVPDLAGIGGVLRPGIVHRLDRDTSGVMVAAKNDAAQRDLSAQFKARTVRKTYEALVWGRPRRAEGLVDLPIGRHPTARVRMAVRPGGRIARTAYRTVRILGPLTFLEACPETGRTHQIRVHLSHIGHPIVGDPLYGGARPRPLPDAGARSALEAYDGLALHARRLEFRHPRTLEPCAFEAPRPAPFAALLAALTTRPVEDTPRPGGKR
ncbi:MAG: RluA family pseudouridine synthase [Candidatus Polarisedimenticolia bacterium]